MAIFKCKMCGGDLDVSAGSSVAECEYCGTKQTVSTSRDEVLQNLFNRANNLRIKSEFDKAEQIYEKILNEDDTDAEAHWGIVLCKYGIEYVEDPKTYKRIPTCHRTSYEAVTADPDYLAAVKYADITQKAIYEREARSIDEIQKNILSIVKNEKPFDVFICYKETDENSQRTQDSVIANDIYYQLTQEGLKVFYAAITLEDKLGQAYEPYIFSALSTAKVMLVIGTRPEYFSAVWVKNEWSRFLKLMKTDRSKLLIPCYRNMDAYDLPEEFAHLQAQDMSKIGFINDVVRGIKKVINKQEEPVTTVIKETVTASTNTNVAPLLRRAFMFLEDGEFDSADEYCEKVLDVEPENAEAYLGKLMVDLRVKSREALSDCAEPFDNNANYNKILRFGNDELKDTLKTCTKYIKERNENARLEGIYSKGTALMSSAKKEAEYKEAANIFNSVKNYKDSAEFAKKCLENARKIEIAEAEKEINKKKRNKKTCVCMIILIALIFVVTGIASIIYTRTDSYIYDATNNSIGVTINNFRDSCPESLIIPEYINGKPVTEIADSAFEKLHIGREINAKTITVPSTVTKIGHSAFRGLKDLEVINIPASCTQIGSWALLECDNLKTINFTGTFEQWERITFGDNWAPMCDYEVFVVFDNIPLSLLEAKYKAANNLYNMMEYERAISAFKELDGYKDSNEKISECNNALYNIRFNKNKDIIKNCQIGNYIFWGAYEQDNNTSNGKEEIEWLVLDIVDGKALVISRYCLDCKPYDTKYDNATWETCTLRSWLNNDFIDTAFSDEEIAYIPTVIVSADNNPDYSTYLGNATQDKVFLLSINEVFKYFSSNSELKCKATAYAKAQSEYDISGNCIWWLRSLRSDQDVDCASGNLGGVLKIGISMHSGGVVVRPAFWIDFSLIK